VVICLERGTNDLRMVQLMPLLPQRLLLHQIPDWFDLSHAAEDVDCGTRAAAVAGMGDRHVTIYMGRKLGAVPPLFFGGGS